MQPSLLQLKSIQLTKIAVEAVSSPSTADQTMDNCNVETFRHQENAFDWIVSLTISFGADRQNARYAGAISLRGDFSTSETIEGYAAENLVNVNGPAILYATAREIIFNLTSRSPNGAWMLPSITFIDRKKEKPVPPEPKPEVARG
jgi:preprotein translocase subunit SecB